MVVCVCRPAGSRSVIVGVLVWVVGIAVMGVLGIELVLDESRSPN
jgi:hypothetical protein